MAMVMEEGTATTEVGVDSLPQQHGEAAEVFVVEEEVVEVVVDSAPSNPTELERMPLTMTAVVVPNGVTMTTPLMPQVLGNHRNNSPRVDTIARMIGTMIEVAGEVAETMDAVAIEIIEEVAAGIAEVVVADLEAEVEGFVEAVGDMVVAADTNAFMSQIYSRRRFYRSNRNTQKNKIHSSCARVVWKIT
jgi:hypothetical protein